jgi:putative membrane protein
MKEDLSMQKINKIKRILLTSLVVGSVSVLAEKTKMTSADLLSRIHSANQEEISAAQIAQRKASSPEVKEYAQKLEKDHTKADELVKDLAKKENISLTTTPMPKSTHETGKMIEHVALSAKLKTLGAGPDFDKAYIEGMQEGHRDVIKMLKTADTSDAQVKRLVNELLPKLEHHRDLADHLESTVITKEAR